MCATERECGGEVDWEYLFLLARRHSIVPLVYRSTRATCVGSRTAAVLAKLKHQYLENSARNTILTAELCRLITRLPRQVSRRFRTKARCSLSFAYGNLALRRFVDLDVIVRKSDVLKAREILLDEGYTPAEVAFSLRQQELLLRTQHNMQFSRDNHRLIVELHWEVAPHLFASSVRRTAVAGLIDHRSQRHAAQNAFSRRSVVFVVRAWLAASCGNGWAGSVTSLN